MFNDCFLFRALEDEVRAAADRAARADQDAQKARDELKV